MNISEFERTKPIETMAALNALIKKVGSILNAGGVPEIYQLINDLETIQKDLFDIKMKLKEGR